ncbi:hypothetical protein V6N13_040888 [Hibiscus sabdariffa]
MEVIKRKCFDQILEVTNLESSEFIKAMEALEERARKCYEGTIDHCDRNDENQLPFFVIFELYCMIMRKGEGDLDDAFFVSRRDEWIACMEFKAEAEQKSDRSWKFIRSATELEDAGIDFLGEKFYDQLDRKQRMKSLFVTNNDQAQRIHSLFDITFTKDTKVLKIPTLHVDDNTERLLRNFMAYEQFTPTGEPTCVSDYVFMDNLINTGRDVQLLCNSGIINNWLGDDELSLIIISKLQLNVGTGHHLKKWPCQSRSGQGLHVPSMDLAAAVFCLVSEVCYVFRFLLCDVGVVYLLCYAVLLRIKGHHE